MRLHFWLLALNRLGHLPAAAVDGDPRPGHPLTVAQTVHREL